jgi:hypothetical protein
MTSDFEWEESVLMKQRHGKTFKLGDVGSHVGRKKHPLSRGAVESKRQWKHLLVVVAAELVSL